MFIIYPTNLKLDDLTLVGYHKINLSTYFRFAAPNLVPLENMCRQVAATHISTIVIGFQYWRLPTSLTAF